jgi:hypothetical protein
MLEEGGLTGFKGGIVIAAQRITVGIVAMSGLVHYVKLVHMLHRLDEPHELAFKEDGGFGDEVDVLVLHVSESDEVL